MRLLMAGSLARNRSPVPPPLSPAAALQRFRRRLAELVAVASGKIAEVPEAERERDGLDAVGTGKQPLAHQPQAAQAQIAMQAHAAIAAHDVVQGADGQAE